VANASSIINRRRIDLVRLAVGDVDEGPGSTAEDIQQRMQLDRGF
jgi:hypothetical protein